ncbi:MAG: TetR family transcriptional regulator [Roseibium sp.]|nr:TetR family transcriptional regulator [Roseibium sp.]
MFIYFCIVEDLVNPSDLTKPPTSKGMQTADRVRRAALKLFARYGYAAVSMRQIAGEVGVQPGALYNHFRTKQDILKDLMLTHMADLIAAWDTELEHAASTCDPLETFTRFHIRYHLERADAVFVSYMELRNLEPENFRSVEAERRRYESILTNILAQGAADGRYVIDDPKVTTRALIAMLTGIPTWFRNGGGLSRAEVEDLYTALARKAVSAHPAGKETGERMA